MSTPVCAHGVKAYLRCPECENVVGNGFVPDAGTPTPRTDSFMRELSCPNIELPAMWYEYAKGLERELSALRAAREAAQVEIRTLVELADNRLAAYTKAQAEIAALREDAARYRVVRTLPGNEELLARLEAACSEPLTPDQFDAAIDAARKP